MAIHHSLVLRDNPPQGRPFVHSFKAGCCCVDIGAAYTIVDDGFDIPLFLLPAYVTFQVLWAKIYRWYIFFWSDTSLPSSLRFRQIISGSILCDPLCIISITSPYNSPEIFPPYIVLLLLLFTASWLNSPISFINLFRVGVHKKREHFRSFYDDIKL